jgi:hypothetical protein
LASLTDPPGPLARLARSRPAQAESLRSLEGMQWLPLAVASVRAAARLAPTAARAFDVLPAWFEAARLIAADEWLVEYSAAQQAALAFARHVHAVARLGTDGSAGASSGLSAALFDQRAADGHAQAAAGASAALRLAARVLLALLAKLHADKAAGRQGGVARTLVLQDGPADVRSHVLALQKCAGAEAYRTAPRAFFLPLEAMLARPCSLEEWRAHVLTSLFPMALYLPHV